MDVDVAIVGGGPAGCAAALALRKRGCSTTVIAAPTRRQKPTETAVPTLAHMLRTLGAAEALRACEPCFGICSGWGRPAPAFQPSIVNPFGHAWFVHRTRFDSYLRQVACDKGAQWMEAEAQNVYFDSHGVSIETTDQPVRASWIIFATGSPSWPARFAKQTPSKIDSLMTFWANISATLKERVLFVETSDCGWWYLCPSDGSGAVACFVTDPPSARTLGASHASVWNKLFEKTELFRRLEGISAATSIHVAPINLTMLSQSHGTRWIAVGDAAMKLDPLSSSGIATALDSGRQAAQAVAEALQNSMTGFARYARWNNGLIKEFSRQRDNHYASELRVQGSSFWARRLNQC